MRTSRRLPIVAIAFGLVLSGTAVSAQETGRGENRAITISDIGWHSKRAFGATIDWNRHHLRTSGKNALRVSLVATRGSEGTPLLRRGLSASADRPGRHYTFSLNRTQKRLIMDSDGVGISASQRVERRNGLYGMAFVARSGAFPRTDPISAGDVTSSGVSAQSRCSPVQAGGSYSGCYYGYTDLSTMNLSSAIFSDAQFPFATLQGTNFSNADLHLAQMGYANLRNANLSNADLSQAYLYGANLSGATTQGWDIDLAQFCNTVMPDGTQNNTDC